jgi:hypothetical protein
MRDGRETDRADDQERPIFREYGASANEAECHTPGDVARFERDEEDQYHEREHRNVKKIGIEGRAPEVEKRIDQQQQHEEHCAPSIDHPQRQQPAYPRGRADDGHGERIHRPVRGRKDVEPKPCDPTGQRWMLAIAPRP